MSEATPAEKEQVWEAFLERWPLHSLKTMTLEQYCAVGTQDSFCNWLEVKSRILGSNKGGSAFKFGVFKLTENRQRSEKKGRRYSSDYGWMGKYGDSAEEAFENVRREIITAAQAASAGDLATIDKVNLGETIRWKIAFLYQDKTEPCIAPIYKGDYIRAILNKPKISLSDAQRALMDAKGNQSVFDYGAQLNVRIEEIEAKLFSAAKAKDYLDDSVDFEEIQASTQQHAGYETDTGAQLVLEVRKKKNVTLYFQDGQWLDPYRDEIPRLEAIAASETRNSKITVNAPKLGPGTALVQIELQSMEDLSNLLEAYSEADTTELGPRTHSAQSPRGQTHMTSDSPLNQILFGPPGTGKTFTTTLKAVSIADPDWTANIYEALPATEQRAALTARYQALVEEQRIVFTTFHQSFSYEDFVEGIRANTSEHGAGLSYDIEPGVFKQIAEHANKAIGAQHVPELSDAPTVWKISIGRSNQESLRQACLDAGEARIGWSEAGDLANDYDERPSEQQAYWDGLSNKNRSALNGFSEDMAVGDVLLCLKDLETVQAVGIVTSDYHYDQSAIDEGRRYAHVRKVNWLLSDIELSILPINQQRKLARQTLHQLDRISWQDLLAELHKQGYSLPASETQPTAAKPNHVLIIDEINRGNTSRIFGELITLLEDDKRKGASDEKSITLPYSKERFSVPSNLYLIGTMNTADKSLAQMDLALRRRFSFVETPPQPERLRDTDVHGVNMADLLRTINQRIEVLLDAEHSIGHAYLMPLNTLAAGEPRQQALANIFRNKIIPLLQEYFFDDYERIGWVLNDPDKAAEHRFIQQARAAKLPKLSELFSTEVAEQIGDHAGDRRHRINPAAFDSAEAYQGIVDAGEKTKVVSIQSQVA